MFHRVRIMAGTATPYVPPAPPMAPPPPYAAPPVPPVAGPAAQNPAFGVPGNLGQGAAA